MSQGLVLRTGTFSGTGQSPSAFVWGLFNVSIWGTFVATVQVERSLDGGTTWIVVAADGIGTPAAYTSSISLTGDEIEQGTSYRLNCTAYTSGTINYRISSGSWRHRV